MSLTSEEVMKVKKGLSAAFKNSAAPHLGFGAGDGVVNVYPDGGLVDDKIFDGIKQESAKILGRAVENEDFHIFNPSSITAQKATP